MQPSSLIRCELITIYAAINLRRTTKSCIIHDRSIRHFVFFNEPTISTIATYFQFLFIGIRLPLNYLNQTISNDRRSLIFKLNFVDD